MENENISTPKDSQNNPSISSIVGQLLINNSEKRTIKKSIATWSKSEIKTLEKLVQEHGTDFAYISLLMGKERDQVKRKFKIMEKLERGFGFVEEKS